MSETPGLVWRYGKRFRTAWWVCRGDIAKAGYPLKTRTLWRGSAEPSEPELREIGRRCSQLQHEMLDWRWKPRARKKMRTKAGSGYVYFVRGADAIKIGFAANVKRRMGNLQHASCEALTLLGYMRGSPRREKQLHHRFRSLCIRGEWFAPHPRLLKFIAEHATQTDSERHAKQMPNVFPASV